MWIFDHSCHGAYAENALSANKIWGEATMERHGQSFHWSSSTSIGIPKGLIQVLKERGINTKEMKLDDMGKKLASHPDFRDEKINMNWTGVVMFVYCSLSSIVNWRCWAQHKGTREHTQTTQWAVEEHSKWSWSYNIRKHTKSLS